MNKSLDTAQLAADAESLLQQAEQDLARPDSDTMQILQSTLGVDAADPLESASANKPDTFKINQSSPHGGESLTTPTGSPVVTGAGLVAGLMSTMAQAAAGASSMGIVATVAAAAPANLGKGDTAAQLAAVAAKAMPDQAPAPQATTDTQPLLKPVQGSELDHLQAMLSNPTPAELLPSEQALVNALLFNPNAQVSAGALTDVIDALSLQITELNRMFDPLIDKLNVDVDREVSALRSVDGTDLGVAVMESAQTLTTRLTDSLGADTLSNSPFTRSLVGLDNTLNTVLDNVGTLPGPMLDGLVGGVGDVVSSVVTPVVDPIVDGVSGVVNDVVSGVVTPVVDPVVDGVTDVVSDVVGGVVNPIVTPVVDPIVDVVTGVVNPIVDNVVNPVVDPIVGGVTDVVTGVVNPIVDPIVDAVVNPIVDNVVNPVVDPIVGGVTDVVTDVVTGVVNPIVTPVVDPIVDVVTGVVNPIVTPVVDPILTPIVDTVSGLTNPILAPVVDTVNNLTGGTGGGVLEPVAPVVDTVTNLIDPVTDLVGLDLGGQTGGLLGTVDNLLGGGGLLTGGDTSSPDADLTAGSTTSGISSDAGTHSSPLGGLLSGLDLLKS